MTKVISYLTACVALALILTASALAQTTTTTTRTTAVQNPDGSWTVVEYPVGREVTVDLTPATAIPRARVLRSANGTVITVDPSGFASTTGNMNLYAVDPMGKLTLLGPITTGSTTPLTFNTNLDKFMLVVSPEGNLTTISPTTTLAYRSAVPQGLSVVPLARSGEGPGAPVGEKVAATASPNYNVAMLGVPSLPVKKETEVRVNFANTTNVNRANFFVTPNFNNKGTTRVKAKFHELSDVPGNAFLTLWAVSPDGKFWRIGSTPNKGTPNVATIDSDVNNTNVPFPDFGLFLTVEPTGTAVSPTGTIFGTIIR